MPGFWYSAVADPYFFGQCWVPPGDLIEIGLRSRSERPGGTALLYIEERGFSSGHGQW